MKIAIETGDDIALRQLLEEVPARANELIRWGKDCRIATPPLHYILDMLFEGKLATRPRTADAGTTDCGRGQLRLQRDGKGHTPLIGAVSLEAEDVALNLSDAKARPKVRGLFGDTTLRWTARLG